MEIVFILLPITLLLALLGVGAYVWSVRTGQFDDLETPALKPLIDGEPAEVKKPDQD
jgi:cbb3-type cytochrome oxidase maturation protein